MTANLFGIAVCTVSSVILQVCKAIAINLGPKYLKLPGDSQEMRQKFSELETKFGMVQAFGCIDGTHIPIKRPMREPQDYFHYEGDHSLNVQAVFNCRGQIMDVEWPGSVHDTKMFANSSILSQPKDKELPETFQEVTPSSIKIPNYLVRDPA